MTNHYLVDALNNGLTRILKDIANTYPGVDYKDLSERYLVRASAKKQKRRGHVSAYNIFVKETRPSIVGENPNLSFAEIAAQVSRRWKEAKKDKKRMSELENRKNSYAHNDNQGAQVDEPVKKPVQAPAPAQAPEGGAKKGGKSKRAPAPVQA